MDERDRTQFWKFTTIGILVVVATAVITGLVVANRTASDPAAVAQSSTSPSASPSSVAQAPPAPPATPPAATSVPRRSGVPSQEAVNTCNRQAAAQAGSAPREGTDKALDVGKDAGIGALGGAAVGAAGGAIAGGGKGAGKGALIGGLVGAGGGTLYGIWDNKKNDERFREAYASCMRARGYYTG